MKQHVSFSPNLYTTARFSPNLYTTAQTFSPNLYTTARFSPNLCTALHTTARQTTVLPNPVTFKRSPTRLQIDFGELARLIHQHRHPGQRLNPGQIYVSSVKFYFILQTVHH
jgi:hypothetical protein